MEKGKKRAPDRGPFITDRRVRMWENFLRDLQNPEVFGHAVTQEVRDEAKRLLA